MWLAIPILVLACVGEPDSPAAVELPELSEPAAEVEAPRGPERPVRELTIALSGELRGEIEPCGCPTLPFGGFVRREGLLRRLESEGLPVIQLDAGETFLKGLASIEREDVQERARLIAQLMGELGVQVMAPGPSDLDAVGLRGLRALPGPRMVSASWLDEEGEPLLPEATVVQQAGLRLGVIGLSGHSDEEGVVWRDPVEAARAGLAALPQDLDLVVALSNLRAVDADRVAREVPGVALILSTKGAELQSTRTAGDTPIVEVPDRGRYLSLLRLRLGSEPQQSLLMDEGFAEEVVDLLRTRALVSDNPALEPRLQQLEAVVQERGRGRNLLAVEERPLGSDLQVEGSASERVTAFKQAAMDDARRDVEEPPEQARYVGSSACASCHSAQLARWTFTSHSRAGLTLVSRQQQDNPECLECHTTGFGEPGGNAETSHEALRAWGGVQCEECHGPLGGHPRDSQVVPQPVSEETCLPCHDQANSPNFDYESYLRATICPTDEGS